MNDTDLWVQWWAFPWRHAHPDWYCADDASWPPALARNHHIELGKTLAIEPCLPCPPTQALLRLALASAAQKDFILALMDCICRPAHPGLLDTAGHQWCQRLAKALHTSTWINQTGDVLQLLQAWAEPPVWQRLRLCFAQARVMAFEQLPLPSVAPARLNVFWQAVLWRAHTHPES